MEIPGADIMELTEVAIEIDRLFPELEGRAVVVSDAAPTKENTPRLPICMVMFERLLFDHNPRSNQNIPASESFAVEFWLKLPEQKDSQGNATAYWASYNYKAIARRMVNGLINFGRKTNGRYLIQAVSLDYGVDSFAVMLTFKFNFVYQFCIEDDEQPITPVIRLELEQGSPPCNR